MDRESNGIKNIVFALLLQGVNAILQFATRSAMIHTLGIQSVAINGLFTEVIAALSLAELGIGSAIVFNLYKPLAEGDTDKVNQLMTLFRQAYSAIALFTFLAGTALCPWIPGIVNNLDYSDGFIRCVYFIFVIQCAGSYLCAYKISLLNADQKSRVVSFITAAVKILFTILQILTLYITHNFICYLLVFVSSTFIINISASLWADRHYPYLKKGEKLPINERNQVFSNIKNLFFQSLCGKIVDSTDNILISVLVNTLLVGYYANYLSVIGVLKQFANQMVYGLEASIGNLFVSEDPEHCEMVIKRLDYVFCTLATVLAVGTYACVQPFISLWIGEAYLLPLNVVIWCCINMYCYIAIKPLASAMHVIGRFDVGRNISITSALVNVVLSIILGKRIGMPGIFIGTFSTFFIEFFLKTYYVYRLFYKKNPVNEMVKGSWHFLRMLFLLFLIKTWNGQFSVRSNLVTFLVSGCISVFLSLMIIISTSFRTEPFSYWKSFVTQIVKRWAGKIWNKRFF